MNNKKGRDVSVRVKRFVMRFLLLVIGLPLLPFFWIIGIVFGHELDFRLKDWIESWKYSWQKTA